MSDLRARKKFVVLEITSSGIIAVSMDTFDSETEALQSIDREGLFYAAYVCELYKKQAAKALVSAPVTQVFTEHELTVFEAGKERFKQFAGYIANGQMYAKDIAPEVRKYAAYLVAADENMHNAYLFNMQAETLTEGDDNAIFYDDVKRYHATINSSGENQEEGEAAAAQ